MATVPGPPPSDGARVGEVRDGYRWTGTQWVPVTAPAYKTPEEIRDEENRRKLLMALATVVGLILIGLVIWWIIAAVNDDDDDDDVNASPSPVPSASEVLEEQEIALTCPQPIGNVVVTTDPNEMWAPGDVVDSDVVLDPVAFGVITFTNTDTGEKFTEPAVSLTDADRTGAVECTFTDTVEDDVDENGDPVNGTIEGTVTVVAR